MTDELIILTTAVKLRGGDGGDAVILIIMCVTICAQFTVLEKMVSYLL